MNVNANLVQAREDRLKGLALVFVMVGVLTGCGVRAGSPSPKAQVPPPSATATFSSGSHFASAQVLPTVLPNPTAAPSSSPNITASDDRPSIRWISAGQAFPQTPAAGFGQAPYLQVYLFGWSHGYVGFRTAEHIPNLPAPSFAMVSTSSADGLDWTAGRALDVRGLEAAPDITAVVEGPGGLLAVGRYTPGRGGPPQEVVALWISADGLAWARVQPPGNATKADIYTIGAGSSGYIASGTLKDGSTPEIWLSRDGRSWREVPSPTPTCGLATTDGATVFAGGYVLSCAPCGGTQCEGQASTSSLWWSADGTTWIRAKVSGTLAMSSPWVSLISVSEDALMARVNEWDPKAQRSLPPQYLLRADGRSWKLSDSPSNMLGSGIVTDGQHCLAVGQPEYEGDGLAVATVGDDLAVADISQSGDRPVLLPPFSPWIWAFGPAGLVVLSTDSLNLWLGVPVG
jgi:hypothetical protein